MKTVGVFPAILVKKLVRWPALIARVSRFSILYIFIARKELRKHDQNIITASKACKSSLFLALLWCLDVFLDAWLPYAWYYYSATFSSNATCLPPQPPPMSAYAVTPPSLSVLACASSLRHRPFSSNLSLLQ